MKNIPTKESFNRANNYKTVDNSQVLEHDKKLSTSSELTLILLKRKVEELSEKVNTLATKESLNGVEETLRRLVDSKYFTLRDKIDCHISARKEQSKKDASKRNEEGKNTIEAQKIKLLVKKTIDQYQKTIIEKIMSESSQKSDNGSIELIKKECERLAHENANIIKEIEAHNKRQIAEINEILGKKIEVQLNALRKKLIDKNLPNKKQEDKVSTLEANYNNCLSLQAKLQTQLKETNETIINLKEVMMNKISELTMELESYKQENLNCKPAKTELIANSAKNHTRNNNCKLLTSSKKPKRPPHVNCNEITPLDFNKEDLYSDDENSKLNNKLFSQCYGSDAFCESSEQDFGNPEEDKELLQFIGESIKRNNTNNGIINKDYLGDIVESKILNDFVLSVITTKSKELEHSSDSGESFHSACDVSQKTITLDTLPNYETSVSYVN